MNHGIPTVRQVLGACWLTLAVAPALGQTVQPVSEGATAEASAVTAENAAKAGSSTGSADSIDKLLDLADRNVSQLSQVRVATQAPSSVAPSFNTVVTTVNRTPSTVGRTPSAVFVITNDMIRRSGATTIMDALRLAPGVQVARINTSQWAISIRGFNDQFTNTLLVQIDGRTVYTQLFAGTFWDAQDVVLADVERIEVIRGPGSTIWGANAVNGVINIITKRARDTQGVLVQSGGGNVERNFTTGRVGGQQGTLYYRAYGKHFDRGTGFLPGAPQDDFWSSGRGGFRMDWEPDRTNTMTLQGDCYYGSDSGTQLRTELAFPFVAALPNHQTFSGQNVLYRFSHQIDRDSSWTLQTYFDQTSRQFDNYGREIRRVYDVDLLYQFALTDRHKLVSGAGYQWNNDSIWTDGFSFNFDQSAFTTNRYSYFLQDEISLTDSLLLTVGSKFVHHTFSPFNFQPGVRALYMLSDRQAVWGGITRAVRIPSRAEEHVQFLLGPTAPGVPIFSQFQGNPNFLPEELLAYELGYRAQPTERFSWDVASYYNRYDRLRTLTPGTPTAFPPGVLIPMTLGNDMNGESYGCELSANYQFTPTWRLYANYTYLRIFLHPSPGVAPSETAEGSSPVNQALLQSSWTLAPGLEFDLFGRYVDRLAAYNVPSYVTMDCRVGWRPGRNVEFSLVGQNLLDRHYFQFGNSSLGYMATEVRRAVYGMATWKF